MKRLFDDSDLMSLFKISEYSTEEDDDDDDDEENRCTISRNSYMVE